MKFGSKALGVVLFLLVLLLMIFIECLPFIGSGPPPMEPVQGMKFPEKNAYFGFQFAGLAPWAKVWMSIQDIIIGAGLFFVLWRKEAQIYMTAYLANHIFLFAFIALLPAAKITLGLAALSHWLWIPALYIFIKCWSGLEKNTGYKTWVTIAIAQIIFSLTFDIPEGIKFLAQWVS